MRARRGARAPSRRREIGEGLDDLAGADLDDGIDYDDDCPVCGLVGWGITLSEIGGCLATFSRSPAFGLAASQGRRALLLMSDAARAGFAREWFGLRWRGVSSPVLTAAQAAAAGRVWVFDRLSIRVRVRVAS